MNTLFHRTLDELEEGLTCRLLGSALRYPKTVKLLRDKDGVIIEAAKAHRINQVPLKETPDRPISHIARVDWRAGQVLAREPVALSNVVAGDTPVSKVVGLLLERGFLLLLNDETISHILTPSDLNKLPMTLYVFTLISHMEGLIADAIDMHFPDERWLDVLFVEKRREIERRYGEMRAQDFETRRIDVTTLSYKLVIVGETPALRERITRMSHEAFKQVSDDVVFFRNQVAHGNPLLSNAVNDPAYQEGGKRRGLRILDTTLTAVQSWIRNMRHLDHR